MVRTKMVRKKSSLMKRGKASMRQASASVESLASTASSASEDSDGFMALTTNVHESPSRFRESFEDFYEKKLHAKVQKYELCIKYVKDLFSNILNTYPESYLNANLNSRYDEKILQDLNTEPNAKDKSVHQSRLQTATSKEPTEFKKPRTPRKTSSRTSRKRSLSAPAPTVPPPPEFKTPLNVARKQLMQVKSITPKVSNTPVSVMRRPQHGEVAFSTCGSPLLIGPVSREDIPTVSVPLQDGRVFSILPDPGMPPEDLPTFDEDTKKYLKTLRAHLAMLSNSP